MQFVDISDNLYYPIFKQDQINDQISDHISDHIRNQISDHISDHISDYINAFINNFIIAIQMVKFTIKCMKPEISQEIECETYEQLINHIATVYNFDPNPEKLKFMLPLIKDQATFANRVKEGSVVKFKGEISKDKELSQKMKESQEKKLQQIERKLQIQEMEKKNPNYILEMRLIEENINQRPFSYVNEYYQIENSYTEQFTGLAYLLRLVLPLRQLCRNYKNPQNVQALILEEILNVFELIQGGPKAPISDPLDWACSVLAYCLDDFDFPYPIFDNSYLVYKFFETVKYALATKQQIDGEMLEGEKLHQMHFRKENESYDKISKIIGSQMVLRAVNSENKELRKQQKRYFFDEAQRKKKGSNKKMDFFQAGGLMAFILECNLSEEKQNLTMKSGIREKIVEKRETLEKIIDEKIVAELSKSLKSEYEKFKNLKKQILINRFPDYLFINSNRVGYEPLLNLFETLESEIPRLPKNKKLKIIVPYKEVMNFNTLCTEEFKARMAKGRYYRSKAFYQLSDDKESFQTEDEIVEKYYKKLDNFLMETIEQNEPLFHNFYYGHEDPQARIKKSYPTGDFRLIGVILHSGDYYHNPDDCMKESDEKIDEKIDEEREQPQKRPKHDCRGDFIVMVYRKNNEWLKVSNINLKADLRIVPVDDAVSPEHWGPGEWTPVLQLYKMIRFPKIE